ncbi:hypothetical protein [Ferrimonas marina]|uniref:Uncharacterized protein n=1 Tax=Ferrimonas marina TaxID=299255 RepID=A0A1M5VT39_9GAMM|nr:hypothetical protein [Ferrimonas marina]SHH78439.1 hypothetical protein SAMN02745129_2973 [Ferrimonas marina]
MDWRDFLLFLALALSIYAALRHHLPNGWDFRSKLTASSSRDGNDTPVLEREAHPEFDVRHAPVAAHFIKDANGQRRLKIWNCGNEPLLNLTLTLPTPTDQLPEPVLAQYFPLEQLDCFQSVDLPLYGSEGEAAGPRRIILNWLDEQGLAREHSLKPGLSISQGA